MDDLISRQKAIEILGEHCKMDYNKICGKDCECMEYMALRDLPSASQWIPCSERLPEEFKTVLCCTDVGEIFIAHVYIFADGYYSFDNENGMICEGNDVAWMPLPEPYKGEEE